MNALYAHIHSYLTLLPRMHERKRGTVIALFVKIFNWLFVCGHKNEHFEWSRPVYELYLQHVIQKSENIHFFVPHDRKRPSKSSETLTF